MSIKWTKIEPTNGLDKKLYETFTNKLRKGYAEFGDEKTVMVIDYANIADRCANLEVRDTDIFVASYPKTGTTWTQEMVWMIVNNLDVEKAKKPLIERFPFLELSGIFAYGDMVKTDPNIKLHPILQDSPKCVDEFTEFPRMIKTHLPWHLLPRQITNGEKKPKIIYVTRNAKDTCVSFYYHCILKGGYNGDFETFCELFMGGRLNYGNFWNHILGYWKQMNQPDILFVKYEDMKHNLSSVINKVASFLGNSLTEDQVQSLVEHLSFDAMKKNPSVDESLTNAKRFLKNDSEGLNFYRSGTVGGYKRDMSPEMEKRFDEWIEANIQRTGIQI